MVGRHLVVSGQLLGRVTLKLEAEGLNAFLDGAALGGFERLQISTCRRIFQCQGRCIRHCFLFMANLQGRHSIQQIFLQRAEKIFSPDFVTPGVINGIADSSCSVWSEGEPFPAGDGCPAQGQVSDLAKFLPLLAG